MIFSENRFPLFRIMRERIQDPSVLKTIVCPSKQIVLSQPLDLRARQPIIDGCVVLCLNPWLGDLFRLHHGDFVRYAARLVGGQDNGEEVVQNAYLRLAGRSAAAATIEHPKAYVLTATRTAAIDFTLRQQAEWSRRIELDHVAESAATEDPIHAIDRRQRIAGLAIVLNELPQACRNAFIMNKIEGYSHREIAERLGVSISMVEKHIIRALVRCRDVLRDYESP
jgi:RNA polymerase sigma factor (sigma-70 family)